jgi:hypothetical protein
MCYKLFVSRGNLRFNIFWFLIISKSIYYRGKRKNLSKHEEFIKNCFKKKILRKETEKQEVREIYKKVWEYDFGEES